MLILPSEGKHVFLRTPDTSIMPQSLTDSVALLEIPAGVEPSFFKCCAFAPWGDATTRCAFFSGKEYYRLTTLPLIEAATFFCTTRGHASAYSVELHSYRSQLSLAFTLLFCCEVYYRHARHSRLIAIFSAAGTLRGTPQLAPPPPFLRSQLERIICVCSCRASCSTDIIFLT